MKKMANSKNDVTCKWHIARMIKIQFPIMYRRDPWMLRIEKEKRLKRS